MHKYCVALVVCISETLEVNMVYCLNMDIINSHWGRSRFISCSENSFPAAEA